METDHSLPPLLDLVTGRNFKPDVFSQDPHTLFFNNHFNIILNNNFDIIFPSKQKSLKRCIYSQSFN